MKVHRPITGECRDLAESGCILDALAGDLRRSGLIEAVIPTAQLVYLVAVSRLLPRPASIVVKGQSSSGKSWTVKQTMRFFPSEAYHALTAMSEKALVYDETPLSHRMLLIYEADGVANETTSHLLRTLLSEGRITYTTVEKTKDGLVPRTIDRPGPTGLITTTTALKLHPENETRLLSVAIPDSPEQTRAVLDTWGRALEGDSEGSGVDYGRWHALQHWLHAGRGAVTVPYGGALASLIPPTAVRLRRDFITVGTLIQAHALLHQATRELDAQGSVVAALDDYAAVRSLVGSLIAFGVRASVKPEVRQTVEAAEALGATRYGYGESVSVTVSALARQLGLDVSTASARKDAAIELGFMVNLESSRGRPAKLILGEPLPTDEPVLPTAEAVSEASSLLPPGERPKRPRDTRITTSP